MKPYLFLLLIIISFPVKAQNVGIGTITPAERLHIIHTADVNKNAIYGYASQTSSLLDYQNTGIAGFGQGNGLAGSWGYGFGVKGIGSTNSYGAVGVYAGLATFVPTLSFNNNFYALYADAGTAASNRHAAVFLNGNVGIGTSSPTYKLDVNGDANITGALRTNGNSGIAGQVFTSNGVGAPTWTNSALSNNTRFAVQMPSTLATNNVAGFMTFTSNYNTNATNITIGTDYITINLGGLYHFEGTIYEEVNYGSLPSYAPSFTLDFNAGSAVYNLIKRKIIPVANYTPTFYYDNNSFSIELYIPAGNQVKLSRTFNGSGSAPYYASGWFTGYLISE